MNDLRLLQDKNKVKLNKDDLFDRIINIKLKLGKPAEGNEQAECLEEYVIRSDYEIVYSDVRGANVFGDENTVKSYTIRRCTYKPSIKVQCNMVTANTGTSVDIYISNFFIFTSDGQCLRSINSAKYPVVGVDVAMGYWGQFSRDNSYEKPMTLEDFFTIDAPNGADMLRLSSGNIVVTTDKLPPDSTLHIHGYVADILSEPVAVSNVKDFSKASENTSAESNMSLRDVLYNHITRRYVRGNRINKSLTAFTNDSQEPRTEPVVNPENGLMAKAYADEYGVQVFLSKGAEKITVPPGIPDAEGKVVDSKLYFEAGKDINSTITRIQSSLTNAFEFRFTNEGNLLVYTHGESANVNSLYKDFESLYAESVFAKVYQNMLPAVYNINIDAVSTITCPFFTFIQPFQKLQFASRYALTSKVGYYANYDAGISVFSAIKVSLSFATVDNINEVQITAVNITDEKAIQGVIGKNE